MEPWEASDGAIHLARELARTTPEDIAARLPALAELARMRHFGASASLQQTLWRSLPAIGRDVGKPAFKRELPRFLDPLFAALTCDQPLVAAAAGGCVSALRDWLGPGIWAGRLTPEQQALQRDSPDVLPPAGRFVARPARAAGTASVSGTLTTGLSSLSLA